MKRALPIAITLTVLDIVLMVTLVTPLAVALMLALGQRWAWFLTPDVALPGDLTLPQVQAVYARWGFAGCAWYWLVVRNRLHGLDFVFAQRLPQAWDQSAFGLQVQGDLWWRRTAIWGGKFQRKTGWRLVIHEGLPYGVPCATITRA